MNNDPNAILKSQHQLRPLVRHIQSTTDVRHALERSGYSPAFTRYDVRYAEFHEHVDGKERHAILAWDTTEGVYRAGHVILRIKDGYWYGEFEQGSK